MMESFVSICCLINSIALRKAKTIQLTFLSAIGLTNQGPVVQSIVHLKTNILGY